MKYIILLIVSAFALSSCSQQEVPMEDEVLLQNQHESVYGFRLKMDQSSPFKIDSCLVTDASDLSNGVMAKVSSFIFDEQGASETIRVSGESNSLHFSFYTSSTKSGVICKEMVKSDLKSDSLYTWVLSREGDELNADLVVTPWQEGGIIIVGPDSFDYALDLERSELPTYVRVSATKDTLYVPACKTKLLISLDSQIEAGWLLQGEPLEIKRIVGMDYLANQFQISLPAKSIGEGTSVSNIYFGERGSNEFLDKALVVVQEPLRLELLQTAATEGAHVNYATYVDGTLARVKEGYTVQSYTIQSDSPGEYQWIVMQRKSGRFNIEGGFKPNDKDAHGQLQTSTITIEYSDGVEEDYAFTRQRCALPVVKFGSHYWSKFNMRGNSKAYDDQISFDMDRADMWSYLKNCDGNAFIAYAGSQYCGTNPEGLDLVKNKQGKLVYEGYSDFTSAFENSTINSITTHTHCPPGYQVPSEEEMKTLIGASVVQLVGLAPMEEYQNAYLVNKERYSVDRYRRNPIVKSGIAIDDIYHLKITNKEGEALVLNGMGYQSEAHSINSGYWLFATVSNGKDQAGFNNARNHFYMQSHSGQKTVSVRCVKTPVNYVID
ncbi:MAG: hypothetical protein ACRCZY_08655 [Phocaeicola sp.]